MSTEAGVLRGLHCQVGPNAQGKLVRCIKGAIYDVAVDVRQGSPTFGNYVGAEISAENWMQIWVPAGFLHAYCTLTAETEVPSDRSKPRVRITIICAEANSTR